MAKKPITGILKALDEELGTKLFKSTPVIPKGVTITRKPKTLETPKWTRPAEPAKVHPDLLRGVDPATIKALLDPNPMRGGSFTTGVSLDTIPPLERVFHATNRRLNYDQPIGDISDVGLHVSPSPNVTDFYALTQDTKDVNLLAAEKSGKLPPGVSLAGPRTYPLLMDPGVRFQDFPIDAGHWNNPQSVADQLRMMGADWMPGLDPVLSRMERGKSVSEAFQEEGYDSVLYPHLNMYNTPAGESLPATMVFDPSRVVPEFSTIGQELKARRGVANPETKTDRPKNIKGILANMDVPAKTREQAVQDIWDPRPRRLETELRGIDYDLTRNFSGNPADKVWLQNRAKEIMDQLTEIDPEFAKEVSKNRLRREKQLAALEPATPMNPAPWIKVK